jgi:pimeloyl-ACP methyl ester carboxylesterase
VAIKLSSSNPELISKVVLVDSAGFAMDASKKIFTKAAAKIVKPFFKPKFMQPLRKKIYQKIGAEDYLATPELQKTFVNVTGEDLSNDMKKIQAPTLIIFGENDKVTPVTYGELMKFLIPNSKCRVLKGAGHFSFLDKPEEFAEALKDFIK